MNRDEKHEYLEQYKKAKAQGIPFWPDALFKDAVVSFFVFVGLVILSIVVGAELGDRADPADDSYTPRPEWYFMFLFQLLKYFPGNLEWLGVVVIPGIVLLALLFLPWLDRSPKRHISQRPVVLSVSLGVIIGMGVLTYLSWVEKAPPSEGPEGDPVAALYVENCSGCHGPTIAVPDDVDLADVIASGGHEGMPAWSGTLSADEIDALTGFILSPNGATVFRSSCAECHEVATLGNVDPFTLRTVLEEPEGFEPHAGLEVDLPSGDEASALINFLIAPDGHRLFAQNCAACHGNAVAFAGTEEELRTIIEQGAQHQTMPAMSGVLPDEEIAVLAEYVVDPAARPDVVPLYEQNCTACHGSRIPQAPDVETAIVAIAAGGSHEDMPVWGQVLTPEQVDALTAYALETAQGSPAIQGQELYARNCVGCHGEFGEGGPNPANPSFVIPPISTGQYLATRDDTTLRAIINQGQPDSGMSPFGLAYGGPLDQEQVGAIVAFIRSWQADPPIEIPPAFEPPDRFGPASETYAEFCAQCHGASGEGGVGPAFAVPEWQATKTDGQIYIAIEQGHDGSGMIAWGGVLSDEQIAEMVAYIRSLEEGGGDGDEPPVTEVSFSGDVQPILDAHCTVCHGALGGWSAEDYDAVMETGDNAPVVVAGDPDASILAQRVLGTQGALMPPAGSLSDRDLEIIVAWILQGAPDN